MFLTHKQNIFDFYFYFYFELESQPELEPELIKRQSWKSTLIGIRDLSSLMCQQVLLATKMNDLLKFVLPQCLVASLVLIPYTFYNCHVIR